MQTKSSEDNVFSNSTGVTAVLVFSSSTYACISTGNKTNNIVGCTCHCDTCDKGDNVTRSEPQVSPTSTGNIRAIEKVVANDGESLSYPQFYFNISIYTPYLCNWLVRIYISSEYMSNQ